MKSKNFKNDDPDYEIKFWKDWLEGDHLERLKMVNKLPIIKEIPRLSKLPKKFRDHTLSSTINGFFEDLQAAVYTKISLEQRQQKKKCM